jgi:ketosteroid isomerase-like protein
MNAREFAVNVYRAVDSMDPPAQLAFFSTIAGLEHELFAVWSVGDNVIVRMTVTYTRKDGKRMTFPAAVIWKIRDELISEFRIYVDNSPLFAP